MHIYCCDGKTANENMYCLSTADFVWSDEWMEYNGHTYRYFSDLTISGHRARSACRSLQGLLVSVNTQAEHVRKLRCDWLSNAIYSRYNM